MINSKSTTINEVAASLNGRKWLLAIESKHLYFH